MQTRNGPTPSEGPSLIRALSAGAALAVVAGNVIGSGIFLKPGIIAAQGGDFRLILAAWVLGGLVCILGALCFAELAVMLPHAGGVYVYLREAYGPPVAFLFGWNEFLFNRPGSIGALSVAFIGAMSNMLGWEVTGFQQILLALTLIASMAWVNVLGVVWGGRVQSATTLVKASFLGIMALLPFAMVLVTGSGFDFGNYQSTLAQPPDGEFMARFGLVLLGVMWAYNGWHGITPVAEEVKNPQKNIPLALFGGVGILIVLYVSANIAYHGVLSMQEMAEAGQHAAEAMVSSLLGPVGAALMAAVIMCSTFGGINSNLLLAPRVAFAMGRDRVLFPQLGRVHPSYRTPAIAICIQALMAAVLVVASGVLIEVLNWEKSIFHMLTDFVIFAASIFYVLAVIGVLVLRRKHPEWPRSYRTLGYPVVPLLYVGFYTWFLGQVYLGKTFEANAGLLLIACGLPAFYGWQSWMARRRRNV